MGDPAAPSAHRASQSVSDRRHQSPSPLAVHHLITRQDRPEPLIPGESTQSTQSAQDPGNPAVVGRFLGPVPALILKNRPTKTSQQMLELRAFATPCGSIGSIGSIPGGRESRRQRLIGQHRSRVRGSLPPIKPASSKVPQGPTAPTRGALMVTCRLGRSRLTGPLRASQTAAISPR